MSTKKPRIELDLEKRIEVIKKLDQRVPYSKLAIEYGVSKSTISKIKDDRAKHTLRNLKENSEIKD